MLEAVSALIALVASLLAIGTEIWRLRRERRRQSSSEVVVPRFSFIDVLPTLGLALAAFALWALSGRFDAEVYIRRYFGTDPTSTDCETCVPLLDRLVHTQNLGLAAQLLFATSVAVGVLAVASAGWLIVRAIAVVRAKAAAASPTRYTTGRDRRLARQDVATQKSSPPASEKESSQQP